MINGMHAILYSTDADADREALRALLDTRSVDAGGGWLIMALPPAEIAVHPTTDAPKQELYLMCDDIQQTTADLSGRGIIVASDVSDQGWGLLTTIHLPSGAALGLYQPRHPTSVTGSDPR
jgi:hypothetical protein